MISICSKPPKPATFWLLLCSLMSIPLGAPPPCDAAAYCFEWKAVTIGAVSSGVTWHLQQQQASANVLLEVADMVDVLGELPTVIVDGETQETTPSKRFTVSVRAQTVQDLATQLDEQLPGFEVGFEPKSNLIYIRELSLMEDATWCLNRAVRAPISLNQDCGIHTTGVWQDPQVEVELAAARDYLYMHIGGLGTAPQLFVVKPLHTPEACNVLAWEARDPAAHTTPEVE